MTSADPGLRQRLYAAKLAALVRSRWDDVVDSATPLPFPGGAALLAGLRGPNAEPGLRGPNAVPGLRGPNAEPGLRGPNAVTGRALWVLGEEAPERTLGPALLLASRRGGQHLHLLVGGGVPGGGEPGLRGPNAVTGPHGPNVAGVLARRSTVFSLPATVWAIEGAALVEAPPEPPPEEIPLPEAAEPYRVLIRRAGAEPVVEAGVLRAEVRGLEVARVEVDEAGARLAVGVGKHDREAKRTLHGEHQGWSELFEAVQFVSERRVPRAEGSPAYHLAPERWLRSVVVDQPHLVGAAKLVPVPPPVVRGDLRQTVPAPAAGEDEAGRPLLVLCSVGIDLDLVPTAADAWLADGRRPRLLLCVPQGDDHPALHELVALLEPPVEIVTVSGEWRAATAPAPPPPPRF